MDITTIILAITSVSSPFAIFGYFLMRSKFKNELDLSKKREEELARRAYETAVLKEIGDRIGYSLDAVKIVEIISGSLGKLVPYSTVCHMIFDEKKDKVILACNINESVSSNFLREVKNKMIAASVEMAQKPFMEDDLDESISGNILNEESRDPIRSFFNLPIVIAQKLVGVINVSSTIGDLYNDENTEVLYKIAKLASEEATKLQQVLDSEKSRLVQAVQSLSDGLLMVDTKYHLVLVNKKLCQLLGVVSNPSLFDIANSLSGNLDLRSMMEEAIATDEELPAREITVKEKTLQVVASRVLDKIAQKPMGVVVLLHDITDAKSLEKLRQDFTSMMVHELRAPLTNIKSTAELLIKDSSKIKKDESTKYLANIDSTSLSMLELVNDLLDVAKMEADKFDVISESGDLAIVIAERVESFKPQVAERGLKLNLVVDRNLPKAYFDKVRIKQVINNLISNALKFTQAGEITVKVSQEVVNGNPIDILVAVSDTGIGIDREEANKLFSRFGQLVMGRRTVALKGSGLGLYIAKGIVEAQGGRIWFKSEGAGLGSTFYFTVPIADNELRKPDAHYVDNVGKMVNAKIN